jgi:AGZA family xanthine/uracil permease-like MFS transporter
MQVLERLFTLKARKTTVLQELRGAVATFLTMAYILVANPLILSAAGIPQQGAIACTALAAGIGCIMMGLSANFPVAMASGMGLNAFIASLVTSGQMTWQTAMGLIVLDGLVVLLLVVAGIREAVMDAIPKDLRLAIGAGIGLFIALIGLVNAQVITVPPDTIKVLTQFPGAALPPVGPGQLRSMPVLVFAVGFMITAVLFARKVTGALVIGMVATTFIALVTHVSSLPKEVGGIGRDTFAILLQADVRGALRFAYVPLLLAIIMVDFFDTLGTATAIAEEAGLEDESGRIPRLRQLLMADAVAASIGGLCGVSSVTCYIESAAGVTEGARTGLHTVFVGVMFLAAIALAPLVVIVPAAATAPALILVGFLMIAHMRKVDVDDWEQAIPAFVTFLTIPLTYSIAHGIAFGFVTYVGIKVFALRFREVHPVMYGAAALLAGYLVMAR